MSDIPRVPVELAHVLASLRELGRDANGSILFSERRAWLDEQGIVDQGEREAFHRLWNELEAERRIVASEELERMKLGRR